MLKRSFMLAYQTTRTFVTIIVPRLPWSLNINNVKCTIAPAPTQSYISNCFEQHIMKSKYLHALYIYELSSPR